ncbi:MAG: hypothetical protein EXR77_06600 [Myxococcales bacterium]|nr:hypothetical protein [Myxococcales bacterium]
MRTFAVRIGLVVLALLGPSCGDPPLDAAAATAGTAAADAEFGSDGLSGGADSSASGDGTTGAGDATTVSDAKVSADSDSTIAGDTGGCKPDCADKKKQCGPDGCGGSCGFCASNAVCGDFVCKAINPTDACKAMTCGANAACVLGGDGSAKCVCNAGYGGDGITCIIADCQTANGGCDKNATCTEVKGAAPTCACKTGFDGSGKICKDIDECEKKTAQCAPKAVCKNTDGSYECSCDSGFEGDGLAGCTDIDECKNATAKCGSDQVCDNTVGSFVCSCAPGYTKSAQGCNDIDECTEKPCSDKATCKNSAGSFTCTCNSGWQGDGKTCTEVDLCKTVTCGGNAICQKGGDGKATCVCVPGYLGDGKTCTQAVVDIVLLGVFVAPLMADGDCWDSSLISGCNNPSKAAQDAVAKAMTELTAAVGTSTWAAKTSALEAALQGLGNGSARPDAYGDALLQPSGASIGLSEVSDSNAPLWSNVKWSKVFLSPTTVLKVTLADSDLALDEEIGTVSLQVADLSKALAAGSVAVAIPVLKQEKQILAVKVLITAWVGCGDGKCLSPETVTTCKADCATTGPKCGDAKCDSGETVASCPTDCKVLAGSCKALCGKQSAPNGCWCDDYCETAGDCCLDKKTLCSFGCKGKCGQKSQSADNKVCWCDEACVTNKDCCTDIKTMCP